MACTLRDAFPTDQVAMRGAAMLFHRLAARDEARLTLTRYLGPSFPSPVPVAELLLLVARYTVADNNLTGAVMALEESLKQVPDSRDAYRQLGKLHQQQGNWNEAARVYQRALARWPNDAEFTAALARVSGQEGNYALAMALYKQTAAMLPAAEPLIELGMLYDRQGDDARARDCWQAALARPGGQVSARLALLASYEHHNENDRAQEMWEVLQVTLANERTERAARWRTLLTAAGLTATSEEIDALLLLEPDLTDPATLERPAPPPDEPAAAPEPILTDPATPEQPAPPPDEPATAPEPIITDPATPEQPAPPPDEPAAAPEPILTDPTAPEQPAPPLDEPAAAPEPNLTDPAKPEQPAPPPDEPAAAPEPNPPLVPKLPVPEASAQ